MAMVEPITVTFAKFWFELDLREVVITNLLFINVHGYVHARLLVVGGQRKVQMRSEKLTHATGILSRLSQNHPQIYREIRSATMSACRFCP